MNATVSETLCWQPASWWCPDLQLAMCMQCITKYVLMCRLHPLKYTITNFSLSALPKLYRLLWFILQPDGRDGRSPVNRNLVALIKRNSSQPRHPSMHCVHKKNLHLEKNLRRVCRRYCRKFKEKEFKNANTSCASFGQQTRAFRSGWFCHFCGHSCSVYV